MLLADRLRRLLADAWSFLRARLRRGEWYGLGLTLAVLGIGAALWGFVELVDALTEQETLYRADQRVRETVGRLTSPAMTPWVVRLTSLGNGWILTVLTLAVGAGLLWRRRWVRLFELVFAMGGGGLLLWALKAFFARARPEGSLTATGGFSFPSGHSFGAMVFFGFLAYLARRETERTELRLAAIALGGLLILLIGVSRVYLGVHWLTDVLGGFLAGFAWLAASLVLVRTAEHRRLSNQKSRPMER